ncbi:MAG: hypothetical protein QM619_13160 [Micropruina sp.]|uniref:hypothetical protein n=1 Tax=Micropruina sp. TaxID=2737536 RepID=UPI0039E26EBD
MKRLLTLLSLMVLSACTIGQPGTPIAPTTPSGSPSVTDSAWPSPSDSAASADDSASPSSSLDSASPDPDDSTSLEPSESASTEPSESASTEPSSTPSATTTPLGSAGAFRAPGEVLDLNGEVTITVLDSKRAKISGHRASQVLVMAKTCNVAAIAGIELTWDSWVLLGPDSEEYPASTTHGNAEPVPVYPNGSGRLYKPGQCAKGWIVFDVPTDAKLSGVRYMNSNGDSGQWRLNANI